jgi:hypothetical protein
MKPVHMPTLYFFKICFNIILTLMPKSPMRVLPFRLSYTIKGRGNKDKVLSLCGPKRRKGRKEWRKLLHNPYCSPFIRVIKSRHIRWPGHVACMGKKRNAYKILLRNSEGKSSLGRSR